MSLIIPVLLGTGRSSRQSEHVANFVLEEAKKFGFQTRLIDVREYPLTRTVPPWQENLTGEKWKKIAKKMDGLIVVTPEYNHSYPGELKMMLDQAFDEYARKPVALCGVSSGNFGGVRVVEMVQPLFTNFAMVPVPATVYFSNVEELFDKKGKIKDTFYYKRLKELFQSLLWYATVLKHGRKNIPIVKG